MDNSNQYDALLVKYVADDLSVEEKTFVENWINADEQNKTYFEELKRTWNLLGAKNAYDKVNVDDEWNHFKQSVQLRDIKVLPVHSEADDDSEDEEKRSRRKTIIRRLLISTAVAASLLLFIGINSNLFFNKKQPTAVTSGVAKKLDSAVLVVRREVNETGNDKRLILSDGSFILLANNSEIIYREPFTNKREIMLVGKAFFKVAKDTTKPFTVVSGDISTTALGTEFTVTAFENSKQAIIRLYEGKVVVKAVDKTNQKLKKDVYLLPGQEFVYNSQTVAKLKNFKLPNSAALEQIMNEEIASDHPSIPQNTKGSWYMFNNQPLSQVFDQLAEMYNVPITYEKNDLQNMYFIGRFDKADSLEVILKQIGILNNLTIARNDKGFAISK